MKESHKISKLKYMQIMRIIRAKQMTSEDLDSLVTDLALKHATNVNNNGITDQVEFILQHMNPDNLIKNLSSILNQAPDSIKTDKRIKDLLKGNKKKEKN